jgi:hypothetical protein
MEDRTNLNIQCGHSLAKSKQQFIVSRNEIFYKEIVKGKDIMQLYIK